PKRGRRSAGGSRSAVGRSLVRRVSSPRPVGPLASLDRVARPERGRLPVAQRLLDEAPELDARPRGFARHLAAELTLLPAQLGLEQAERLLLAAQLALEQAQLAHRNLDLETVAPAQAFVLGLRRRPGQPRRDRRLPRGQHRLLAPDLGLLRSE